MPASTPPAVRVRVLCEHRDFSGYNFRLPELEEFNCDDTNAEMVRAFISSDEYRKRFGQ